MRLKVTPKFAIEQIDQLIRKADEQLNEIFKIIDKSNKEKSELERTTNGGRLLDKKEPSPDTVLRKDSKLMLHRDNAEAGGHKNEAERITKEIEIEKNRRKTVCDFWKRRNELEMSLGRRFAEWTGEAHSIIKEIFLDYTPFNIFEHSFPEYQSDQDIYIELSDNFEYRLKVLREFYLEISKLSKSPLFYIKEKAQICFYDFVLPLTPNTNESLLCQKVFEYGIGELVEESEIINFITGNNDFPEDKDLRMIKNAIDGVNRKTNSMFGFSLLKHSKGYVSIIPPKAIFQ